jgi:multidrug resistance efflux pump
MIKNREPLRQGVSGGRLAVLALAVAALAGYAVFHIVQARRPYEWSGTVEARAISVGSRAGGRVREVVAREGQRVTAGAPLVVLEPGDLEAQRLMAEGQLAEAEANLEKLRNGSRPEEIEQAKARAWNATASLEETRGGARREQIAAADARLEAARATAERARVDADRARHLFATQAIPQAQLDEAEMNLRAALAQQDAATQEADELKNGSRREDIAQAQARAAEARASAQLVTAGARAEDVKAAEGVALAAKGRLDQVRVLIDELTVRAPVAARVETLDLRPGDILGPNATAATLVEDDQLYVRIYVPETQLGHVRVQQQLPVSVDSFPGRTFTGIVEHINSVGEYSPRNLQTADERANQVFATRVGLRSDREDLRAGMAAFVRAPQ